MKKIGFLCIILCMLLVLKATQEEFNTNEEIVLSTEVEDTSIDSEVTITENEDVIIALPSETETTEPETEILETETESVEPEENIYYCEWGDFYLTQDEYELLLTTTFCESGNQPSETQQMTALVILNRLEAGMGGDTVRDIVYAKNAFSVTKWKNFEDRGWTDKVQQSVDLALKENPHPRNMYYFRTKHYHSWAIDYKKSGDVYFSLKP